MSYNHLVERDELTVSVSESFWAAPSLRCTLHSYWCHYEPPVQTAECWKNTKRIWRSHPSQHLKSSKHLWCLIRCKNLFKAGQERFLLWKNMINGFASSNMEMRHCMCCVATKYPSNKHHVWTRQSHTAGLALLNSTIWCLPILYCRLFLN